MSRTASLLACLALVWGCSAEDGADDVGARDLEGDAPAPVAVAPAGAAAPGSARTAATADAPTGFVTAAQAPAECTGLSWTAHLSTPSWPATSFPEKAHYQSGVLFADVNGDGAEDLVVSSGNDELFEEVEVYHNKGGDEPFGASRDWPPAGGEERFHGKAAAGDLDKDGCNELVVAVFFDQSKKMDTGGVVLYQSDRTNGSCALRNTAEAIDAGFLAPSLALADVNGDGWLDLAVAVAAKKAEHFPPTDGKVKGDFSRIYLNRGVAEGSWQGLAHVPPWKTSKDLRAGDVEFADLDGDGFGDLVFAARAGPRVFFGEAPAGPNHQTGITKAGCPDSADAGYDLSFSVDVARIPGDGPSYIAHVSADTWNHSVFAPTRVWKVDRSADPCVESVWTEATNGRPAAVHFANLLGDGTLHLVAGRWSDAETNPAAGSLLRIYEADGATPPAFTLKACLGTEEPYEPVVNGIAVADVRHGKETEKTSDATLGAGGRLVTLPDQSVEAVTKVEKKVGDAFTELGAGEHFAWVPGENWVSLGAWAAGQTVRIHYRTSTSWDIAYGDWKPNAWPRIHYAVQEQE